MSKIDWQDPIAGSHTGTDGLGVVVTAKQARSVGRNGYTLHIDTLVYLDTLLADPRPAIEAAIQTLRKELGMES